MVKISNYVSEFLVLVSAFSARDFADTWFAYNRLIFQMTKH
jgi:hypothetical protein